MLLKVPSRQIFQGDYGWHTGRFHFSFGDYEDPKNCHFGKILAFNEFIVEPGSGFDPHPHQEAEIISYCIEGELIHSDSLGNTNSIKRGQMQYICAGSGIIHSEYNHSPSSPLRFIQIWIQPNASGLTPRYEYCHYKKRSSINKFLQISSNTAKRGVTKINQDANVFVSEIESGNKLHLNLHSGRNAYLVCLEGTFNFNYLNMQEGDAVKIWNESALMFQAITDCRLILVDIPGNDQKGLT